MLRLEIYQIFLFCFVRVRLEFRHLDFWLTILFCPQASSRRVELCATIWLLSLALHLPPLPSQASRRIETRPPTFRPSPAVRLQLPRNALPPQELPSNLARNRQARQP